jgi:hypothetical protein
MSTPDSEAARLRLDAALAAVADAFRGGTAAADEHNCECHWGSAEELALLKTPDVPLGPDLLRRTWWASDWDDNAAVLRRILPELAVALVAGEAGHISGPAEVGIALARGHWQDWPTGQAGAVREFLRAWWLQSLVCDEAVEPPYAVFAFCVEASGEVGPWLAQWEAALGDAQAAVGLARAVEEWDGELWGDRLPWFGSDEDSLGRELVAWLVRVGVLPPERAGALRILAIAEEECGEPSLQPLPPRAAAVLSGFDTPLRLVAHLRAVHEVAAQLVAWVERECPGLVFDREAVLFGAATHDIGKVLHPEELSGPGSLHEESGRRLLLGQDVPRPLARFAATHGAWGSADVVVEDLLVSLADKVWKAKRVPELEDLVVAELARASGREVWEEFLRLDEELTRIGEGAAARLAYQASYPVW